MHEERAKYVSDNVKNVFFGRVPHPIRALCG
jgi:hypothetical protein